jgi:hypothetical protein
LSMSTCRCRCRSRCPTGWGSAICWLIGHYLYLLSQPSPRREVAGLADSQSHGALPYRSRSHGSVVPRLWVPASEVTRVVRANKGSSFRKIGSNAGCSGEQRQ